MRTMKKTALFLAVAALAISACGPTENAGGETRVKNDALATSASATRPGIPPQIFVKIDTVDLTPNALQGTPKFVARLRWSAPVSDGGSPITGYDIQFRWNSFERGKNNYEKFKNWTSCAAENQLVPNSFPVCAAARTSTATTAEISSDYWQTYSKKEESHLVHGLEYRVAAINAVGTSDYSPATQQTCKYGGACEFGDLGPGGGVVYDVPTATRTSSGWTSRGASEVAGADWEYSSYHSWAAAVWAGETSCPGWSCYAPIPPQPCLKTNTAPVQYTSNYDTCLKRDAWHLPFSSPYNNVAEWRPLCNKFDDLSRTWGKLRGGEGFFYWSASAPIIPAGISINLTVMNVVSIIASPGPGNLIEIAQESYDRWSTSSLGRTQALRFPCDSKTKTVTIPYNSQGRLFDMDNKIYHDNSVRSGVNSKSNLSRPIRFFTTNKPAIAPQIAPRLVATSGDGGVILSWVGGTPDATLTSALGTAQILPLTSYAIEYKRSSDSQWTRLPNNASVNMSRIIGNGVLSPKVAYDFRVAEVNSLGTGPFSQIATATPGKFVQSTLSVTMTSGTFPGVDLATSGGEGSGAVTYTATNGTATGCKVEGGRLVVTRVGTCSVVAKKEGDAGFLATTSKPTIVAFTPAQQAQLSITSLSSPFDQPLTLAATGGSGDGELTFAVNESDRDICKLTGTTLSFTPRIPQTGTCRVTVAKAASDNYLATASATTNVNFTRGSQTPLVIEQPQTVQVPVQKVTVKAKGGSGLGEATFTVRNGTAKNCAVGPTFERGGVITTEVSVNKFDVSPLGTGTCVVTVTRVGDATYLPATSSETTVTFARAKQDVVAVNYPTSFPFTGAQLTGFGGSGSGAFSFAVVNKAPSRSAFRKAPNCRINGSILLADGRGVCWVTATRAGDDAYEDSATSNSLEILLVTAPQPPLRLTLSPTSGSVGSSTKVTTTVTGGAGTGKVELAVRNGTATGCVLSNGNVSAQTTGTCTIVATKAADTNYESAQAEASFTMTIGKQATLTIAAGLRGQALSLGTPVTLATSGGSGTGAVSYTVTDPGTARCTVNDNKLSASSAGQCTVVATKAGDSSYGETQSESAVVPFDIRVGDVGPAGGFIAHVADTPQPWGRYIEAAPGAWSGGPDPVVDWATGLQRAAAYRGGGKLDWRLPSVDETKIMTGLPGNLWTFDSEPGGTRSVRPIRTFG